MLNWARSLGGLIRPTSVAKGGSGHSAATARNVARFWDKNVGRHRDPFSHWESPAPIQAELNRLTTGQGDFSPVTWFVEKYGPFGKVADLGCGDGVLLYPLVAHFSELQADAYDISRGSLQMARQRVLDGLGSDERCRFIECDLNIPDALPRSTYDAAFAIGSMHHIANLDACFASIAGSLAPDGVFFLTDYVGPVRFQWDDATMRLANELLSLVPARWRLRDRVHRCDAVALQATDPSEAVASDQIDSTLRVHFEVVEQWARGGTLLAPIFGSGCLDAAMDEQEEGRAVLSALFACEQQMIRDGVIPSTHRLYVARPRRMDVGARMRGHFDAALGPDALTARAGMQGDLDAWLDLNWRWMPGELWTEHFLAPFPPAPLSHSTSGLDEATHFAWHGVEIVKALAGVSPKPLNAFHKLLDFGVGVGRVARLFKGFGGDYVGVDVDRANIAWVSANLPWVDAHASEPGKALPFADECFDGVVSISVFTHLCEADHVFYLKELARVMAPGGLAFFTISGERVLHRAETESSIAAMIAVPEADIRAARVALDGGSGYAFIRQEGHLTTATYQYGITFISKDYVEREWTRHFEIVQIAPAAIHDFQDIVVLKKHELPIVNS